MKTRKQNNKLIIHMCAKMWWFGKRMCYFTRGNSEKEL